MPATQAFLIRAPVSLWATAAPAAPPSADVVAAVMMFHDVEEEMQDGTVKRRFSRERLEREDMRLLLGAHLDRALEVAVIWDPREEQIVRVLDLGPLEPLVRSPGLANRYAAAKMRGGRRTAYTPNAAAA